MSCLVQDPRQKCKKIKKPCITHTVPLSCVAHKTLALSSSTCLTLPTVVCWHTGHMIFTVWIELGGNCFRLNLLCSRYVAMFIPVFGLQRGQGMKLTSHLHPVVESLKFFLCSFQARKHATFQIWPMICKMNSLPNVDNWTTLYGFICTSHCFSYQGSVSFQLILYNHHY